MGVIMLLVRVVAATLAVVVTGAIHYKVHPITEINSAGNALIVAFSFWPGMIIGYLGMKIEEFAGEEDPAPSAAAAICSLLWFVYLFRSATLLIGLPVLSDWTQTPVEWMVKFFEFFV